ncbi:MULTISPECIES: Tim44 domain-containing protein [unclassified Rubrivivax]|uniref:Tim44 domain-containing protein n=1 Tax=unclassified Rubrivivax TaxID=2649762 RepID=UPI001E35D60D|nr:MULTISPECIES: TIM44-like domain-containing protein [unclassified Rubrivivax]MCC9597374.1 39S ribosomal protein L45 [Rubrivivax sp. JA1055]MCC9646369.1 39S ribosomal protein L45 [Rubrivivax sp. JA1029]
MKSGWLVALAASLALTLAPDLSEAKRMGGGKSSGMQRSMPDRTAPAPTPAKPAQPTQAAPNQAAPTQAGAAAGAAAAAGKRSWLGPIAGIAAGLGLAALMSHLGLGAEFANFLTIALLAVVAFFVIRFLLRRFGPRPAAAPAAAGVGALRTGPADWTPPPAPVSPTPVTPVPSAAPVAADAPVAAERTLAPAFVPAAFDSESFERVAKTIFVRLQAANDSADLDDLRRFTTPEMFAELKMDLQDRGSSTQTTDVVEVEAKVVDVTEEDGRQIVSVRYVGRVREEAGAEPVSFDEVWHLVKPVGDDSRGWAIAGIEQMAAKT